MVGLVYAAIAFLNVIFTMGMESSYLRYAKDRDKARGFFRTLQIFLVGVSLIIGLLVWALQPVFSPFLGLVSGDSIYLMMLGILIFDTLAIIPFAELRLSQKAPLFAVLKTGNVIINLGLNFYLILVLDYGIEAVFISNLIASAVTAIVIWIVTIKMWKASFNKELLTKALSFGLPFIPAGIGHVINEMLDRFFLKGMSQDSIIEIYGMDYSPEHIVGVYNACYKLSVFMLLLVQMYRMAWQPFFMRQSDDQKAPELFAQAFKYFNVFAAVLFLGVSLFVNEIVAIKVPILDTLLIGQEYWMGLSIVPFLLIAYWFQGWYVNFSAGIFIAENTKQLAKITLIGAGTTVVVNLVLIPKFGMMGSAIATLTSYALMALLIYWYSTKSFKVPYNLWQGFSVIGLAAIALYIKPFLTERFFSDLSVSILLFITTSIAISVVSFGNRLLPQKSS